MWGMEYWIGERTLRTSILIFLKYYMLSGATQRRISPCYQDREMQIIKSRLSRTHNRRAYGQALLRYATKFFL